MGGQASGGQRESLALRVLSAASAQGVLERIRSRGGASVSVAGQVPRPPLIPVQSMSQCGAVGNEGLGGVRGGLIVCARRRNVRSTPILGPQNRVARKRSIHYALR